MPAQLVLFLDTVGVLHCEAPGANGSRRKVDLPFDFAQVNPEIMTELNGQLEAERDRKRAALREIQNQNINYVAVEHGKHLAKKIWKNGELAFSRAIARKLALVESEKPVKKNAPRHTAPGVVLEI
jgi:hypothetical protein